jgi:hypothetical protein
MGDPSVEDATDSIALAWAKRFWRENWALYECRSSEPELPESGGGEDGVLRTVRQAREEWGKQAAKLESEFLSAATSSDPDLYVPDRHEVLSGITYRMLRSATMLVDSPRLWSMEYGASVLRSVIEALIVLKWLVKKDDPALYERFKNYGRGRVKLLKLHLEEYRDSLGDVPKEVDDQIKYLEALVNQDIWEEFQDISIEGSFSGIDTRRMAEQVDLMTEYRLLFAPASANVHGEWGAIDQYALDVCRNPLHRWHRIPQVDVGTALGPGLVETVLEFLGRLVDAYTAAIQVEPEMGTIAGDEH